MLFLASDHLGVGMGPQFKPLQLNWRSLGPLQCVLFSKREQDEKIFFSHHHFWFWFGTLSSTCGALLRHSVTSGKAFLV